MTTNDRPTGAPAERPIDVIVAPKDDTFYTPPPSLLEGEHGEVIWSRPLSGAAALASARVNQLVLYRSRDVHGKPVAVSGIIALPRGAAPEGGYPIVSWAHGTVGCADTCAPSRDTITSPAHPYNAYPHGLLNAFLDRGWAVVMTDYEGLGTDGLHPYLLGESEAHGLLDIARAARRLYPAELSRKLSIVGHSQGGQAALFGAHHAPIWTPELDLRGVAALAPAAAVHLLVAAGLELDFALPGFAFTALFLAGAIAGNPNIDVKELLTAKAYERWPHIHERARVELSKEESWGGLKGNEQLNPRPNPSKKAFFHQLELMNPALRILAPIRISQGARDQRIRADFTRTLHHQLAALNGPVNVTYKEYEEVSPTHDPDELGFHFGLMDTDLPSLTRWLEERFADVAPEEPVAAPR
ncbi:alpha/beta hydrolase family protein [Sorangium sp. So ce1097]|uniref:alpha/beta hydrolase family protein n=1 Tax=Sorangium sp. So ce1097 TaxID=3133330 RepID=UPI003F5D9E4C